MMVCPAAANHGELAALVQGIKRVLVMATGNSRGTDPCCHGGDYGFMFMVIDDVGYTLLHYFFDS